MLGPTWQASVRSIGARDERQYNDCQNTEESGCPSNGEKSQMRSVMQRIPVKRPLPFGEACTAFLRIMSRVGAKAFERFRCTASASRPGQRSYAILPFRNLIALIRPIPRGDGASYTLGW
jgi:hypothetical protein